MASEGNAWFNFAITGIGLFIIHDYRLNKVKIWSLNWRKVKTVWKREKKENRDQAWISCSKTCVCW